MFSPQTASRIPALMATQHPDNANPPYWAGQAFMSTNLEPEEVYRSFAEIGCDEHMWDWEGKFADEAMIERLLSTHLAYFRKHQLGRDLFITVRIPNVWEEKTFKLGRAYMSVISAAEFTRSLKLHAPPVFELILPMAKRADQLIHIQETFRKTCRLHEKIFGQTSFEPGYIRVIPIFESVSHLVSCGRIVSEYIQKHRELYHTAPTRLRIFIARSDPALNAGFVTAVLAARVALRDLAKISKESGVPIYPIIGTGALPFRGGINPDNIENSLPQYFGAATVTIQSAFRYDYPLATVKRAVKYIERHLKKAAPPEFPEEENTALKSLVNIFERFYTTTIEAMAPFINDMAQCIPSRRERVQHTGLFGYNRGVGKVRLPRAIQFTGACYSAGIPPEFIGTGRGLELARRKGLLPMLEKHFVTLRWELGHAGKFLNRENLERYAKKHAWARELISDISLCEKILGLEFGPKKERHFLHRNLTSTILFKKELKEPVEKEVLEAACLRRSLG